MSEFSLPKEMENQMPMSPGEIVTEYRQAKSRMKQIGILADQNLCSKGEIIDILLSYGEEVPKNMLPKEKKQTEPVPKPAPEEAPAALSLEDRLKVKAYDVITNLLPHVTQEEVSIYSFIDRCYGIAELVKEVAK